jgi:ribosomal protein S18 acetylase RimI-like enzyme
VVPLERNLEGTFWNHVSQDPIDYYFFIYDWKLYRNQTKILLAIEGKKIEGLMLIYKDYIVQLRGKREAVKMLLERLNLDKSELMIPLECEDIISRKYSCITKGKVIRMNLRKGEESIQIKHTPERLTHEDAEELVKLLKDTLPDWWGETTVEMQESAMKNTLWFGIKLDGKIISAGSTRLTDFGSNIMVVATDESYRNMGYATSIVSALVKEILKKSSTALIHALSDNASAIHVYSKVGFKPYKSYLLFRGEKIKT